MKVTITRIGNSRGVRIPKTIIEQVGLGATASMEVVNGRIVISPASFREEWDEAFRKASKRGESGLLDREALPPTKWEREGWEW